MPALTRERQLDQKKEIPRETNVRVSGSCCVLVHRRLRRCCSYPHRAPYVRWFECRGRSERADPGIGRQFLRHHLPGHRHSFPAHAQWAVYDCVHTTSAKPEPLFLRRLLHERGRRVRWLSVHHRAREQQQPEPNALQDQQVGHRLPSGAAGGAIQSVGGLRWQLLWGGRQRDFSAHHQWHVHPVVVSGQQRVHGGEP